jgi:hypothetical protein
MHEFCQTSTWVESLRDNVVGNGYYTFTGDAVVSILEDVLTAQKFPSKLTSIGTGRGFESPMIETNSTSKTFLAPNSNA